MAKVSATTEGSKACTASDLPIVWASRSMTEVIHQAEEIGASDCKVLICGESGVGKDVVARFVHASSRRAHRPLVTVNCAALPDALLESELFGHTRGSFTGAYREKVGQLQRAHQGTLFLDEVGEMSPRMQALLLRFLENGELQPIGADEPRARVDVRVLAATNLNLEERVAHGQFREDLLYRLQVIRLVVPPLRERREDIPLLVEHFLARASHSASISEEALNLLVAYRWPGNVRELRNVVEHFVARAKGEQILPEHLPAGFGSRGVTSGAHVERRRRSPTTCIMRWSGGSARSGTISIRCFCGETSRGTTSERSCDGD
jgi:transcriptional regulator with GAF, ATPase, and Fis domain